jgi:hypothetical protein
MSSHHKYRCLVHQPKAIIRQPNKFHSIPRKVTEENQKFWKGDAPLGASICKECYLDYQHRSKTEKDRTETSTGENMV